MTAAPTASYRQHVETIDPPRIDATSFRMGWRRRTRLDRLLADGRISAEVWQAATEYRVAWESVLADGSLDLAAARVSGGANDGHDRMLRLLTTLSRLRRVEDAIGPLAAQLVSRCAVEDQSWAAMARLVTFARNPETVRDWTVTALGLLCAVWRRAQVAGTARRRVAPL
jgi:hypothetical protein